MAAKVTIVSIAIILYVINHARSISTIRNIQNDTEFYGTTIWVSKTQSYIQCAQLCLKVTMCRSVGFKEYNNCYLYSNSASTEGTSVTERTNSGFLYMEAKDMQPVSNIMTLYRILMYYNPTCFNNSV